MSRKKAVIDFLTALFELLWLSCHAATVALVSVGNKGFTACRHIAVSSDTATGLRHIARKRRTGAALNCHTIVAVDLPLRGQYAVGFNKRATNFDFLGGGDF